MTLDQDLLRRLDANLGAMERRLRNVTVELHSDTVVSDARGKNSYSLYKLLDEGTRAHLILPVNPDGVLVFETAGGEVIFTKRVQHPGMAPRHFTLTAMPIARNYVRSRAQLIASELSRWTMDPTDLFVGTIEQIKKALIALVPGRLKDSFRVEVED